MTVSGQRSTLVVAARVLGRLRWITKARVARRYHVSLRNSPLVWVRFVLLDPEVDNFTYSITNLDEFAECVARVMDDIEPGVVHAYLEEIQNDTSVRDVLRRNRRWRFVAHDPHGYGRRIIWYALARIAKPELVVETGIKDGLGSLLLLRALERNAEDGVEGQLVSFDLSTDRGWLVPASARRRWTPVFQSTETALEPAVVGRHVGLIIHDSEPTYERAAHEFRTALDHAADVLVLISNGDWSSALADLCAAHRAPHCAMRERPDHPFYPGALVDIGVWRRSDTPATEVDDGVR